MVPKTWRIVGAIQFVVLVSRWCFWCLVCFCDFLLLEKNHNISRLLVLGPHHQILFSQRCTQYPRFLARTAIILILIVLNMNVDIDNINTNMNMNMNMNMNINIIISTMNANVLLDILLYISILKKGKITRTISWHHQFNSQETGGLWIHDLLEEIAVLSFNTVRHENSGCSKTFTQVKTARRQHFLSYMNSVVKSFCGAILLKENPAQQDEELALQWCFPAITLQMVA